MSSELGCRGTKCRSIVDEWGGARYRDVDVDILSLVSALDNSFGVLGF